MSFERKNPPTYFKHAYAGFFVTFALVNIGNLSAGSILPLLLFALLVIGIHYQKKVEGRKVLPAHFDRITIDLGVIFTILYVAAEHKNMAGDFDNRLFRIAFLTATTIGLFFFLERDPPADAAYDFSADQKTTGIA